jgi:hypothetical protein
MNCPHCGAEMHTDRTHADWACAACGLAGPRDVLEALAARLAHGNDLLEAMGVLSSQLEAERALKPADMMPRAAHVTVARSRRAWMNAATSVLGKDWNGTPDDLRAELARRLAPAGILAEAERLFDADPSDCVIRVDAILGGSWKLHTLMRRTATGDTLAKAYAELKEAGDG